MRVIPVAALALGLWLDALPPPAQQRTNTDLAVFTVGPNTRGEAFLPAPPGLGTSHGGSNSSLDGYATETRILSSSAVRAIAAHYGRHLGAAGWRRTDVVDRSGLSVTRFAGRARNGDAATAVLTVDLEPAVRLVRLRVVRNEHAAPVPAAAPPRPASPLSRGGGAGAGRAGASRTLPSPFPRDLLPAGVEVLSAAGTSARMIVLARVQNFTAGHFARFAFDLQHSGWGSRRPPMAGGFLAPVHRW